MNKQVHMVMCEELNGGGRRFVDSVWSGDKVMEAWDRSNELNIKPRADMNPDTATVWNIYLNSPGGRQ